MLTVEVREEIWPLKKVFRISRGSHTEAQVVVVTVGDDEHIGRGEGVPIKRYAQSVESVLAQIESIKAEKKLDRQRLQQLLPAGAARNALDCALWDLEAKTSGKRVWELANTPIVPELHELGVELIEQPFPANADEVLENLDHPIPVCADESCHTTADLRRLTNRYDMINVKLDKTGGLTEALRLCDRARDSGFKLLIGSMVGTSLGIAPARLLASNADLVDLDGS